MAVLHGSWISSQGFFLWGETWRRSEWIPLSDIAPEHPYLLPISGLRDLLQQQGLSRFLAAVSARPRTMPCQIALPSCLQTLESGATTALPIYSLAPTTAELATETSDAATTLSLQTWQIQGWILDVAAMLTLLRSLPLNWTDADESNWIGDDLRFWAHQERWSLDLLTRAKVLPSFELDPITPQNPPQTRWQPLLDSAVDQQRLRQFSQRMPQVCCQYQGLDPAPNQPSASASQHISTQDPSTQNTDVADSPDAVVEQGAVPTPQSLLLDFLAATLDHQVRQIVAGLPCPPLNPKGRTQGAKLHPLQQWLQALGTPSGRLEVSEAILQPLQACLNEWKTPIQTLLAQTSQYRACFVLQTPTDLKPDDPVAVEGDWRLDFALQAADDPSFLIRATTLWNSPVERLALQGRVIHHPQETLLSGLGLASRVYPFLERSLQNQRPFACALNPIQAFEFIKSVVWRLQDSGFGVILPPSLATLDTESSRLGLKLTAETIAQRPGQRLSLHSLLNFQWELSIGGQAISKADFERLIRQGTPLVEINGAWVELRPQDVRSAQTFFENRKQKLSLSLEDALRMSMGDTQTIEKLPVVGFEASGALQNLITTLTGNRAPEPIPLPDTFRGELRPYQARGAGWLAFLEQWGLGACLADDMGLGKTIQTIAFLLHLQAQNALEKPFLLVCPTSVLGNWEREIHKFGPTLKTLVHHGDKRMKGAMFARTVAQKQVVITSYALVHRDATDLQGLEWQGLILDEAQNIKNAETKQSQTVRELKTQFRIALTGTPVENRLSDLWSILDFLNPGYLGSRNFFQRRFAAPIERYGDMASLQALRSLVQPFILRRLKTDKDIIQDLPEKQEIPVFCPLSTEQAQLYQHLVEQSLAEIDDSTGIQRHGKILALLVKLKQICNHPAHFLGEATLNGAERSGKLHRFQELLEEVLAENDRALVFTQFAEWGKLLKVHLEQHFGREVLFLYGGTSKKQREELIDRFQHDPQGPRIFILSLKAGGVGLNLTRANHVFHFDRWWNPAVENQATDRVFRIGQTKNVLVHKFICSGTLEEKIHDLIESKKALAEQVVGAGESWLTDLDTDQLRSLLLLDRNAIIDDDD